MAKVAKKAKIMPAKKKVTKKVTRKGPYSSKELEAMINKLGFIVDKNLRDGYANYDLNRGEGTYIGGVSFDIVPLEHCCGVREAGNLYISVGDGNDWEYDLSKDEKIALELLMALIFVDAGKHDVYKGFTSTKKDITRYRPLIFCSNSTDDCILFESAAKKYLRGIFKQVSASKNPGSGSIIKIYISQL